MLSWEVQFCKSSCITSHGCEDFRGIAKECHWWHTRPANLINTSQATKYLVFGKLQKCESREEQGQLLDMAIGVIQGQNIFQYLSSFAAGEI
jgi:hypothetical protein